MWVVSSVGCFFMACKAQLYSLPSFVKRGDHHGLDLGEVRESGVTSSSRAVREFREEENHWSSCGGEGRAGAGGVRKAFRQEVKASQSVESQQGVLGSALLSGDNSVIRMGTWSEPVEWRIVASQAEKAGDICGLVKTRSITPGLCGPERGKRVYSSRVFRSLKSRLAAWL